MICVLEFCSAEWAGEGEAEYKETASLEVNADICPSLKGKQW